MDCRFENILGTAVTMSTTTRQALVARNIVRGGTRGFVVHSEDGDILIEDNQVEDCAGTGIDARSNGERADLYRNRVARCGGDGIYGFGLIVAQNNTVHGCGGAGLALWQYESDGTVERNVVGKCGGDGIRLLNEYFQESWTLRDNTVYSCIGSGISVSATVATVTNNIGFGNGDHGLSWSGPAPPTLTCNDWFANTAGDVVGGPGPSDLTIDPQFCDLANNDVHLMATSPLVDAPACGQIGALGVGIGCGATATLLQRFDADREAGGVQLIWQVTDSRAIDQIHLERAEQAAGPWIVVASERSRQGDLVVDIDRGARSDRTYWYRLVNTSSGRNEVLGSPLEVGADNHAAYALRRVSPNPASGPLRFEFELAHVAPISLDMYDMQGRAVATLARGSWPAGRHTVAWSAATSSKEAGPGVYFVRYRFPGGHQDARLVRIR
jgi:hypothetical protein